MRLDINLASLPYEDSRQFWMRWGTVLGAMSILTLVLLTLTITGWVNARRDHKTMAKARAMIAQRDQLRVNAERILNLPENRSTRDESQVLNQLIERKAFSWTLVLENLEKVMPTRVHLVSISPELDEDNQLALKMTVAGDSYDKAVELARRMEESRRFAQTNITQERNLQSTQGGDTEQFDIAAIYIPETIALGPPAKKIDAKTETAGAANTKPPTVKPQMKNPAPALKGNKH